MALHDQTRTATANVGLAVGYGLLSALVVFIGSTGATWLIGGTHRAEVWLTSASVITGVSCIASGTLLSRVTPGRRRADSRRL